MSDALRTQTTDLLLAGRGGVPGAFEALVPLVYDELKRLAGALLRRERPDHTLQPTALAHECWMRLADATRIDWRDRAQFLAIAARSMRQILSHHARDRAAQKRGGGWVRVSGVDVAAAQAGPDLDVLALDEALDALAGEHPRAARTVELRFFAGLTTRECAEVLGVSETTSEDDWYLARAWLRRRLGGAAPAPDGA